MSREARFDERQKLYSTPMYVGGILRRRDSTVQMVYWDGTRDTWNYDNLDEAKTFYRNVLQRHGVKEA